MSEIRRRKQKTKKDEGRNSTKDDKSNGIDSLVQNTENSSTTVWFYFNIIIGACVAVYIGYRYAGYMKQLHENDMWFSNIQAGFLKKFYKLT